MAELSKEEKPGVVERRGRGVLDSDPVVIPSRGNSNMSSPYKSA